MSIQLFVTVRYIFTCNSMITMIRKTFSALSCRALSYQSKEQASILKSVLNEITLLLSTCHIELNWVVLKQFFSWFFKWFLFRFSIFGFYLIGFFIFLESHKVKAELIHSLCVLGKAVPERTDLQSSIIALAKQASILVSIVSLTHLSQYSVDTSLTNSTQQVFFCQYSHYLIFKKLQSISKY